MKATCTFLALFLVGLVVFPQVPTLTRSNSGPQPGDEFLAYFADTTGVTTGEPGANRTWDFSHLNISSSPGRVYFEPADTYGAPIANATTASHVQNSVYYDLVNDSQYAELGYAFYPGPIYMGPSYTLAYSAPLIRYTYPFTYPGQVSSHYESDAVPGVLMTLYSKGNSTTTADGYGKLILPHATFTGTLRVKIVQDVSDSTIIAGEPPTISVRDSHKEIVLWFDGIHKTPLLQIETNDYVGAGTSVREKRVLVATGLTATEESPGDMTFQIYPVPAESQANLVIQCTEKTEAHVAVLTMEGREISTFQTGKLTPGKHFRTIDVSAWNRGLYLVRCTTGSGSSIQKLAVR